MSNLGRPSSKIIQNGIQKPLDGSDAHRVWLICDSFPTTPKRLDVISKSQELGISLGTASTQYSYWVKFYGKKAPRKWDEKE
jgi:hypothetical protein